MGLCASRILIVCCCVLLLASAMADQPPAKQADAQDIVQFLNQTLDWYHQLVVERQVATEPSSVAILNDNHRIADQAVRLGFDFARAEAQTLTPRANLEQNPSSDASRYQSLLQLSAKLDQDAK